MTTFDAIKFFGALFAIMNPLTNLPVFLSMTEGATDAERRAVALKVTMYCFIMGAIVAIVGTRLLDFFGITTNDFRVAGGFVVFMIGLNMLNGKDSTAHHGTEKEKAQFANVSAVAFYPLTFPLMVGPGTITTLILYRQEATTTQDLIMFFGIFAIGVLIVGAAFLAAGLIGKHMSQTARTIMTRLMGMILAAIAVSMMAAGLKGLLPGLA